MALYKNSWAQGWTAKAWPYKGSISPLMSNPGPFHTLDTYTEPYVYRFLESCCFSQFSVDFKRALTNLWERPLTEGP